jgi:hypothetical protein
MPAPSKLTQTLQLLYQYTDDDQQALADRLFEARREAWTSALNRTAGEFGYRGVRATAPRLEDLDELRRLSLEDAQSIRNTWNEWVAKRTDELYDANPRGNRNYYYSNLERLTKERDAHHAQLIALNTEQTASAYARRRFVEMNGLQQSKWRYVGASPVSNACKDRTAAGVVDYDYTARNETPAHPRCPHSWQMVEAGNKPAPEELWLG